MRNQPDTMNTLSLIHEFLDQRRFAFVGVSRNPKSFSRTLFREFIRQGYDTIPVNPFAADIDGRRCAPSVHRISPPVTSALIITSRQTFKPLLRECCQAGITLAWMYGISGPKDLPSGVLHIGEEFGVRMIAGYCPYMFIRNASWFHRIHTSVWKLVGLYPH